MRPSRRAYVDWLRGLAVLCMIEWHVLDAWTLTTGRDGAAWAVIRVIGGAAAPLFLFLAGVSVPFAINARVSRGADPRGAAWLVERRGWEIFGLAHLFRLQSFLLNPKGKWSSIVAPDILNILGLGLAGTAWLVGRGGARNRRVWWLLLPAAAVLVLTPLSRHWWWPTLLYPRFEAYIRPVGNVGVFALFPWVAFVPVGAFMGLLIAGSRDEAAERRLHQRLAIVGTTVAVAGFSLAAIEIPGVVFWTGVWARFLAQVGMMTLALWAVWAWMRSPWFAALSEPLLLFGRTSLFVYWVHVELAYGLPSLPLHHALPLTASIPGFAAMVVAMYFAGAWWSRRPAGAWIPPELRSSNFEVRTSHGQP